MAILLPQIVSGFMGKMTERMSEVIGYTLTDLDGRFEVVRTAESNLGNLVCDLIRKATGTDVVIINGGGEPVEVSLYSVLTYIWSAWRKSHSTLSTN